MLLAQENKMFKQKHKDNSTDMVIISTEIHVIIKWPFPKRGHGENGLSKVVTTKLRKIFKKNC